MHKDEALKVLPHFFHVLIQGAAEEESALQELPPLGWGAPACSAAGSALSPLPLDRPEEAGRWARLWRVTL